LLLKKNSWMKWEYGQIILEGMCVDNDYIYILYPQFFFVFVSIFWVLYF
jgi:hypothetical protein